MKTISLLFSLVLDYVNDPYRATDCARYVGPGDDDYAKPMCGDKPTEIGNAYPESPSIPLKDRCFADFIPKGQCLMCHGLPKTMAHKKLSCC